MKTKYILLLLLSLLAINSCDLTQQPHGFYSADNLYKTNSDVKASIAYAYQALTFIEYSRSIYILGDLPTEEVSSKSDASTDQHNLEDWKVGTYKNNLLLRNYFKYSYISINRANAILQNVPGSDLSQDAKDKYLGEAYFLRAWNYFTLVKNFGLVPVHKQVVNSLSETTASLPKDMDAMYDLIFSDLRKAINLMKIHQITGRADKVAAQSLAAKAYLTVASSKEHDVPLYKNMQRSVQTMYDSAAVYARSVVEDQSVYGFESNLLSIYDVSEPTGKENILLLSMDRTGTEEGQFSKIDKLFIPNLSGATFYLKNPDGSFTKSHGGFSLLQTTQSFIDSFNDSDKRKTELLVDTVYTENGAVDATTAGAIPYIFTRKYNDPDFINEKTSVKPFLLRFSDIALVLAEAVGPTQKGYKMVNYIRERAGLSDLPSGLSTEQFRKRVLKERKWELAFEGNRLYDLRRFNKVQDVVPKASGLSSEEADFYPIPQREIDLNSALQ